MGMFKQSKRFFSIDSEKPRSKMILGLFTGVSWAVSAVLLFIDAFLVDLVSIQTGISGTVFTSSLITDYPKNIFFTPIYNQVIHTENIITFCIGFLGILAVIFIGLALREKSTAKIWKFFFVAGIIEVFVFSLTNTILKFIFLGYASGIIALIATVLSLSAGILYFTVLPLNDIKAGMILISAPLAYFGGAIAIVLVILLIVTLVYGWIKGVSPFQR